MADEEEKNRKELETGVERKGVCVELGVDWFV